jgi:hemolysin III
MSPADGDLIAHYRLACAGAGMLPDVTTLQALSERAPTLTARGDAPAMALLSLLSSGFASHVTCLSLGRSPLSPTTVAALAGFLRDSNRSVSELRLPRAKLRDEGASAILAALVAAGDTSPLRSLDLRSNKLRPVTAHSLAAAMKDPKVSGGIARLSYLDLSNNYVGYDGVRALEHAAAARAHSGGRLEMQLYGNLVLVEVLNGVTHGIGVLAALVVGSILVYRASGVLPGYQTLSMSLYVISLCTMFFSSCLYHCFFRLPAAQRFWHTADHCSIFILIAGSYTPFVACYTLDPPTVAGPFVLAVVWISAIIGVLIAFKVIRTSDNVRTFFALAMGWVGLLVVRTIFQRMTSLILSLVVSGGLSYSGGIAFYIAGKRRPMMHVYWHLAVMFGGALHMYALWILVSARALAQRVM